VNAEARTYKLGLDLPLSGIDGASAIPARNAVLLAIDEANRAGFPGGARVALSELDDAVQGKHDPAQGAVNLKSFAGDGDVLAVIGPMNSNVAKAEIPISNAAGLAQITMAATSVELTRGPAARQLRVAHPDRPAFFRVCASDDRQGAAAARFARDRGLRRAFVIDDNESYGRGIADVFAAAFPAAGGTVLGREHLTSFALDYKALLTKIRASAPDAIFFGGIVSTGGAVLRRQMADVGLDRVAYLGGDGLANPEYVPLAGRAAENTYFTLIAPDVERFPPARAFRSANRAHFGSEPGITARAPMRRPGSPSRQSVERRRRTGVGRAALRFSTPSRGRRGWTRRSASWPSTPPGICANRSSASIASTGQGRVRGSGPGGAALSLGVAQERDS